LGRAAFESLGRDGADDCDLADVLLRCDDLAPDWLRIGTDITGQGPFKAAFSLTGEVAAAVPEPETCGLMLLGLAAVGIAARRRAHLSAMSTLSK
jgi:hypothetical protein